MHLLYFDFELRFYVPLDIKYVISETFFPANLLASTEQTKPNITKANIHHLLLFWHAPLGVRSAIRRHQPPQRAVLSQVNCFVQCEVVGSQVSLNKPRDMGSPWWSLPVLWRGSC